MLALYSLKIVEVATTSQISLKGHTNRIDVLKFIQSFRSCQISIKNTELFLLYNMKLLLYVFRTSREEILKIRVFVAIAIVSQILIKHHSHGLPNSGKRY